MDLRQSASATRAPSGEKRGAPYSNPGSPSSRRCAPVSVWTATSPLRYPPGSGICHVVTTVGPVGADVDLGLVECTRRGRRELAQGQTRPRRRAPRRRPRAAGPGRGRGRGPRTARGTLSCRIAVTFLSLRSLRRFSSSSAVCDEGSVGDTTTTVGARLAVTTPETPPGRTATTRASPPPAGSSHSAGFASSSLSVACGFGRALTNSSDPSGRNAAPDSPLALRVSRRAGRRPSGSTSHSAVTYFVRLGSRVATAVTSLVPSGLSVSPPVRGNATYASRSWKGPGASSVTSLCYHGRRRRAPHGHPPPCPGSSGRDGPSPRASRCRP